MSPSSRRETNFQFRVLVVLLLVVGCFARKPIYTRPTLSFPISVEMPTR